MANFEYVRKYYGVPAGYGRAVIVGGKPGVIVEDRGAYIGVLFDCHKPNNISPCHPTSQVEYGEMKPVRQMIICRQVHQRVHIQRFDTVSVRIFGR